MESLIYSSSEGYFLFLSLCAFSGHGEDPVEFGQPADAAVVRGGFSGARGGVRGGHRCVDGTLSWRLRLGWLSTRV